MPQLELTPEFENYLYSDIKGTITRIMLARDEMIIQTTMNNYILYYKEID